MLKWLTSQNGKSIQWNKKESDKMLYVTYMHGNVSEAKKANVIFIKKKEKKKYCREKSLSYALCRIFVIIY